MYDMYMYSVYEFASLTNRDWPLDIYVFCNLYFKKNMKEKKLFYIQSNTNNHKA